MNHYGLIGKNISYSFSKDFFEQKFKDENISDCTYRIFDLNEIDEVADLFDDKKLKGLNVTIPYKQKIIPYLDKLDKYAAKIGAVNCIQINDGIKTGFNTDVYGFEISLMNFLQEEKVKALILGDGGASKSVQFVLNKLKIEFKIVSRKTKFNYSKIDSQQIEEHRLIINCTPLGTYPEIKTAPDLNYDLLTRNHFLFDLIYNPEKTLFLKSGEKRGAKIKNGYEMLELQAKKSWEIWSQFL